MATKPTTGCYWQTSTSYSSRRLDERIGGAWLVANRQVADTSENAGQLN